jgi:putative ABC transport system substrate-binding protein
MRRRDILALSALLPAATRAWAQASGKVPVVAFLDFASPQADRATLDAFRKGLAEHGHVEGRTIVVEARHAGGDVEVAARLIDELVRKPVDVFVAPGPAATRWLRRVTTIPVVAIGLPPTAGDHDLFTSLAKPGGTVTGFSNFGEELSAKRIEILREALPGVSTVGIMHNVTDPVFREWGVQTEASALAQGLRPKRLGLSSTAPGEVAAALRSLRDEDGRAVIVIRDFLTHTMKDEIVRSATELGIAVIAEQGALVESGALLTYGADLPDLFRRAGGYVGRIVKGEKAGDLPIQLPSKFEFVINLKAAKALGLTVSPSLLARADEVIE